MYRRVFVQSMAASTISCAGAAKAKAQAGIPLRVVFPFPAGGSGGALARLVADWLAAGLGQPAIVENKSGAGGRIGVQMVRNAAPDGMTLLVSPIAPMAVYQHVYKSLGYDPLADFRPITQLATFEFGLAVGADVPARTVGELVAWVKANPARASYGSPAPGTLPHFLGVWFGQSVGIDWRHIGYGATARPINDLVPGTFPSSFTRPTNSPSCTRPDGSARWRRRPASVRSSCPTCRRSAKQATTSRRPAGSACLRRPGRRMRPSIGSTARS